MSIPIFGRLIYIPYFFWKEENEQLVTMVLGGRQCMARYESLIKPAGQLKKPKKPQNKLQLVIATGAILWRENMH